MFNNKIPSRSPNSNAVIFRRRDCDYLRRFRKQNKPAQARGLDAGTASSSFQQKRAQIVQLDFDRCVVGM